MRKLAMVLAAAVAVTAGAANAQSWGYDEYRADRAFHAAGHEQAKARRDQRRAAIAASYGDYRAADHYARNAEGHRQKARRDAGFGRYERNAARVDGQPGRWGY